LLSAKLRDGEILFVDSLSLPTPKTKEAKNVLGTLATIKGFSSILSKRKNATYVALSGKDSKLSLSMQNFSNVVVDEIRNISPLDVLTHKYMVIVNPEEGLKHISEKLAK
jgi:large subunit ribosomal protein L4